MGDDTNADFVGRLIRNSKKLTEENLLKCQSETNLRELTLLTNIKRIRNAGSSNTQRLDGMILGLEKVFCVNLKIFPSPLQFSTDQCNETLQLSVQNVSKSFSFPQSHWYFSLEFNNGERVTHYKFAEPFVPGKIESFSTNYFPKSDLASTTIRLVLHFSLSHSERCYVKTLTVYRTRVDILFLITPSRLSFSIPPSSLPQTVMPQLSKTASGCDTTISNTKPSVGPETDVSTVLPTITQFFFRFGPSLMRIFSKQILLKDCQSRWLATKAEDELKTYFTLCGSFSMYYMHSEITVNCKEKGVVSFKCSNPSVLFALKNAIMRRLLCLECLTISSPPDHACEKLYALKLRLEEMKLRNFEISRSKTDAFLPSGSAEEENSPRANVSDFLDLYLDLRDVSENILFDIAIVIADDDDDKQEKMVVDDVVE